MVYLIGKKNKQRQCLVTAIAQPISLDYGAVFQEEVERRLAGLNDYCTKNPAAAVIGLSDIYFYAADQVLGIYDDCVAHDKAITSDLEGLKRRARQILFLSRRNIKLAQKTLRLLIHQNYRFLIAFLERELGAGNSIVLGLNKAIIGGDIDKIIAHVKSIEDYAQAEADSIAFGDRLIKGEWQSKQSEAKEEAARKRQAIAEPGTVSESEDADGDAIGTIDDAFSLPSVGDEVAIPLKGCIDVADLRARMDESHTGSTAALLAASGLEFCDSLSLKQQDQALLLSRHANRIGRAMEKLRLHCIKIAVQRRIAIPLSGRWPYDSPAVDAASTSPPSTSSGSPVVAQPTALTVNASVIVSEGATTGDSPTSDLPPRTYADVVGQPLAVQPAASPSVSPASATASESGTAIDKVDDIAEPLPQYASVVRRPSRTSSHLPRPVGGLYRHAPRTSTGDLRFSRDGSGAGCSASACDAPTAIAGKSTGALPFAGQSKKRSLPDDDGADSPKAKKGRHLV